MTDLQTFKDSARREARSQRKTAQTDQAADQAASVFLDSVTVTATDTVALYRAIQSELNPAPLVEALMAKEVGVCFPVVVAAGKPLEFRAATSETRFVTGAFGAAIPEDGSPVVIPSVVVVPLLAFDCKLYRLGYGGGFYDRTLEWLRSEHSTRAYGYAYAAQEMKMVPIESTDERLDGVVTEKSLILG